MGVQHSVLNTASEATTPGPHSFDWGKPPAEVPKSEKDPDELVFHSWVFCKAKRSKVKLHDTEADRLERRKSMEWRGQPHLIELNCGEDSFFVSSTQKVIGIADGVGGWNKRGVDPSFFSNALMKNAKLFSETHRKELDPEVIMDAAYRKTVNDREVKAGSSTACIATLEQQENGKNYLNVANLGDSGLLLVRDRRPIFRMQEKVHRFNTPFQLAVQPKHLEGLCLSDPVSACLRDSIPVQDGDVVVLGTDGLFDNRFNEEIAAEAGWIGKTQRSILSCIPSLGPLISKVLGNQLVEYANPNRVVERLVLDAYKASLDQNSRSPWSVMLRERGVSDAKGGKKDDITVLLSRVAPRGEKFDDAV